MCRGRQQAPTAVSSVRRPSASRTGRLSWPRYAAPRAGGPTNQSAFGAFSASIITCPKSATKEMTRGSTRQRLHCLFGFCCW